MCTGSDTTSLSCGHPACMLGAKRISGSCLRVNHPAKTRCQRSLRLCVRKVRRRALRSAFISERSVEDVGGILQASSWLDGDQDEPFRQVLAEVGGQAQEAPRGWLAADAPSCLEPTSPCESEASPEMAAAPLLPRLSVRAGSAELWWLPTLLCSAVCACMERQRTSETLSAHLTCSLCCDGRPSESAHRTHTVTQGQPAR